MKKSSKAKSRTFRISVEQLENRILLHAGHDDFGFQVNDGAADVDMQDSFALPSLAPTLESDFLDPHLVDDSGSMDPVDFDKILGIPNGSAGPEIERLPDFFPSLSGGFSLDQTTQPGRTLVRFGTQVNNQGNGPAVLISGRPGIDPIPSGAPITSWLNADGSQNVIQAIYDYNGSSFSLSRYIQAGRFTYHSGHGHFHYDGYAYYRLRQNVGGQPGPYVSRSDGTGVIGEKVGFCLINIASSFIMENGQSSTTLVGYNRPGQPSTGCGLLQGIHVGRADVYSSGLDGQWLDVTGVPNGSYYLEMELDGEDAVLETNNNNNTKTFAFNLNANPGPGGINPDVFDSNGESNNSFDTAVDMGEMGTFTQTGLTVHWGQDFDYFRFVATSSGVSTVTATASTSADDVNLFLFDANREQIGSSSGSGSSESISHNFVAGQTYYVKADAYNSSTVRNYQIRWNLKPTTTSLTSVGVATEAGRTGRFVISRNGPTSSPLTVNYTLTGTAVNGVDYQSVPLSVTLGDLQSEAVIDIVPLADSNPENAETVILTISSNSAYVVGPSGTQLAIADYAGDFNLDGLVDQVDVDQLVNNIAMGPPNPSTFDMTNDDLVGQDDLTEWLRVAGAKNLASGLSYLLGDANLDGNVDGQDYNIWNENKFTTVAAWSAGDFNASGGVDGEDFNLWNANKFTNVLRTDGSVAVLPTRDNGSNESRGLVSSARVQRWKSIVDAAFGTTRDEELWFRHRSA